MKPYADTNFFTGILADVPQSALCAKLIDELVATGGGPLPVTWLIRLELANALQRLVFETRAGGQHLHITSEFALMAEAQFLAALDHGDSWTRRDPPPDKLEHQFMSLVARHTA